MMPGMKTESPFGLRREAKHHAALEKRNRLRKAVSPLRSATALQNIASLLLCVFALMPLNLRAATNDLSAALRQGLFEEEANHNLDAAISNYQALAMQFDQDRQIAATAIFRLGECYRKLGRTNEAVFQYQRIVREFSDQQTLATLSQQNLTGLGVTSQPRFQDRLVAIIKKNPQDSIAPATPESAARAAVMEAEAASLKAQIEHLSSLKQEGRRVAVQQNYSNPVLTKLMQDLAEAELTLASLTNDYAPTDLHVTRVTALMNALNGQIDAQMNGVIEGLQAKMEADVNAAKALRAQSVPVPAANTEASSVIDDEDREIRRIQQLIQDSPDLINAPASDGFTPLGNAARKGQVKVATFLLDHSAGINIEQRDGETALHDATRAGNRAMVELLLSRGADVNAKGRAGDTALHQAALHGYLAVAEALLANHSDVNALNTDGSTPLFSATLSGQLKIVQMLLAAGANANLKDGKGRLPLNYGIGNSPEIFQALLDAGTNPNTEDSEGRTPLSYAAERDSPKIVKLLLAAKADPNGGKLDAPLLCAIHRRDTGSAKLLLENGANPNAIGTIDFDVTINGSVHPGGERPSVAPLWLAVSTDQLPMVQLLLKFKADPNDSQTDGRPLLFSAHSNPDILGALLDAGGKIDSHLTEGMTLLDYALNMNFATAAVEVLLQHGANPNARDSHGNTPLHYAVWGVLDRNKVALLLDHHADPNVRNDDGKTPLDYIKARLESPAPGTKASLSEIADLLRQHGALDNLPHWDRITVSRPSANYSETVFRKGTNDWNQISLFDVLGVQYELINNSQSEPQRGNSVFYSYDAGNNSLSFPDLANIIIRRATADGNGWENRKIDLTSALNSGNCAADFQLRWGDVVEIPEKDHVLNERWPGLSTNELFTLKNCLTRHLQISVKGQITNIVITPQVRELVPGSREYPLSSYGAKMEPAVSLLKFEPFMLWPVLKDSKLLLASSDLSHIKVKRRDTTTGKMHEWMVDCSNPQAPPNLWLRDGDVIEVPEK